MSGSRHRLRPAVTGVLHRLAPRTLRGRLSLVALTTAPLLMLVLTVAFNAVAQHRLQHQAGDELCTRASVATTTDTTGTTVRVLETSNDALLDTNAWIYAGRRLLKEPPNAGRLTRVADALTGRGGRRCVTADVDGPLRLCSQPVSTDKSGALVVTALGLSPYRSSADTLLLGSLAQDVMMLACTYALTRLAVGRALRPVRTMTDQATQWSAVASEERFGHTRHPAELARLGTSLDAILDRSRTLLRHERQLTGELSHGLCIPLSRIIAELDWWRTRPRTADETHATHKVTTEAAQTLRTSATPSSTTARSGTLTAPGPAEILSALRRLTEVLNTSQHLTIAVDGPLLEAGVPPTLLEHIVSPLLTNACRYARTIAIRAVAHPTAYASTSSTTGPAYRPRSPDNSSSPADARIPATDTAERAWDCRWRDAWPAPSAAR